MSTVLPLEHILEAASDKGSKVKSGKREDRKPVNMTSIVALMITMIDSIYLTPDSYEIVESGKNWLKGLYELVVFDGYVFKRSVPRRDTTEAKSNEVSVDSFFGNDVPPGQEVPLTKGKVFCYIIKGFENNDDDEYINKILVDEKDANLKLPVVSVKVFQACISILIDLYELYDEVKPAKLGANVIRACTHPEVVKHFQRYAIHMHSGLPYVANYVWNVSTSKISEESKKSALGTLPNIYHLYMMAIRMDQFNREKQLKSGNEAMQKWAKENSEQQTVNAVTRTCGFSMAAIEKITEECVKLQPYYKQEYLRESDVVTKKLVDAIKKLDKGSSVSENKESNQGPGIDSELEHLYSRNRKK